MTRELTARPIQLAVIAIPMAVPVMRGNTSPMIATVVGKTGAMDTPAQKVRYPGALRVACLEHQEGREGHQQRRGQR